MLKKRIALVAVSVTAGLVPVLGATVLSAGPAMAGPAGITCSKTTGTIDLAVTPPTVKISNSGCTGNTGKSGKSSSTEVATSTTVKWKNKTKTVLAITQEAKGTKCAVSPALIGDEVVSGTVKSDTTGSTAKGAVWSEELCANAVSTSSATISNAPGTELTIAG